MINGQIKKKYSDHSVIADGVKTQYIKNHRRVSACKGGKKFPRKTTGDLALCKNDTCKFHFRVIVGHDDFYYMKHMIHICINIGTI